MNDESLQRANAFLAAVADRVAIGDVLDETPAEIGRALGLPDALSTARAVRALIARRRLEPANGSYRLLDPRPVDAGEKEALGRRPRKPRAGKPGRRRSIASSAGMAGMAEMAEMDGPGYSDLGRAVADKLVDLGRENAQLRAESRQLREETREARAARDDAERWARGLADRTRELEARAEMAESNLRSLLASARGHDAKADAPVGDAEMAAILGVLKGDDEEGEPQPDEVAEPLREEPAVQGLDAF
ncbi:MAG TPA: hypothetical protein VLX89_01760 [Actinomycetota bacterium]|nr:hypothetical protein [Actinomycetota bacterium]